MAIRIKEWALQAYPGQGAHLPKQGIEGMADAARALGRGIEEGTVGVLNMQAAERSVAAAGYRSRFEDLYQRALTAAHEGLPADEGEQCSAWQDAREAAESIISEQPADLQSVAQEESLAAQQRALATAAQQQRLDRVDEARRNWQRQLDSAVSAGDEESALQRLERGRELFVPEGEMEERRRLVSSRCQAAAWQQRLKSAPLETLAAWGREETAKPQGGAEYSAVENAMAGARQQLTRELGAAWSEQLQCGEQPLQEEVERAVAAGLLPQARQKPPSAAEWQSRVDALGDDVAAAESLRLQLAAVDMPLSQRRELLAYLERSCELPSAERRAVGAALVNLYRAGRFGCVGDAVPRRRLECLQREAQQRLTDRKAEELRTWLAELGRKESAWVCFEPNA